MPRRKESGTCCISATAFVFRPAGHLPHGLGSVYASLFEGFGIPILEALNCGTPVITSAGGVFPETGGDAALYVDPQSVSEMRAALERVLGSESLRREMATKGAEYAMNFREEALFPTLWQTYERVLNR